MTSGQSVPRRANPWPSPGGSGFHLQGNGYMAPHHNQSAYVPQFAPPNIAQYMQQQGGGLFSDYQAMSLRRPSSFQGGACGGGAIYACPSSNGSVSSFAPYMTPMPPSVITQFYTPYQSIYYGPVTPLAQQQQQQQLRQLHHLNPILEHDKKYSVSPQIDEILKVLKDSLLC